MDNKYMNFKDVMVIGKILEDKFGFNCPICGDMLLAGNIGETYNVYCNCGLEMSHKINKEIVEQ